MTDAMTIGLRGRIRETLKGSGRTAMSAGVALLLTLPASAAVIEGRITDASTGAPLAGVSVSIEDAGSVVTDTQGQYRMEGLSAGDYRVFVKTLSGYVGAIYGSDLWCLPMYAAPVGCPLGGAEVITLGTRDVASGIDLALTPSRRIRGRVLDQDTLLPLVARVTSFFCGDFLGCLEYNAIITGPDGRYEVEAPPEIEKIRVTAEAEDYQREVFDDHPCDQSCDPQTGDAIDTTAQQVVEGIDFELDHLNVIRGRLTDEATGDPIHGGWIQAHVRDDIFTAFSDEEGYYALRNLPDGTYFLRVRVPDGPWAQEIYDDLPCPQADGICDITRGDPITVVGGVVVTGVDFSLAIGGSIKGRVFSSLSGQGVVGGPVIALDEAGNFITGAGRIVDGYYTISGLAAGQYYVVSLQGNIYWTPYRSQIYDGVDCLGNNDHCDISLGTPVAVELGQTVEGIDFPLNRITQCEPSETRLCLNQGRFEVELEWTYQGDTALARAERLDFADDSGYFWFFDEANVEVTVKVLDGCQTQSEQFWVFAAGLTNLETRLSVKDTYTGHVKTYDNPTGQYFQPILDIHAFDTCSARDRARSSPASEGTSTTLELAQASLVPPSGAPPSVAPPSRVMSVPAAVGREKLTPPPPPCDSGPGVLCLHGGRFQVEAIWKKYNGNFGPAMAESLTDETGFFWFFQQDNLEMVVKVLSNCGGHTDRFWVFTAGLTNLGVKWRVTDLFTGVVQTYENPVGSSFQPIFDTRAFATCP